MPLLPHLQPGVRLKFPLTTKFSTVSQNGNECSLNTEPIAVTLSSAGASDSACQFIWLPHAPGGVNYYQGPDEVVSGLFTGCYMSVYLANGNRRIAHVNTGTDAPPDCKDFFLGLPHTNRSNFKPFSGDRDADIFATICQQSPQFGSFGCAVLGIIDPNNICYSVYLRKLGKCDFEVASVVQRQPAPGLT